MLTSELNLYKREWLELVFANRNKQYGAYELRSTSSKITNRALGLMLAFAVSSAALITYISHHRPAPEQLQTVVVDIIDPPPTKKEDQVIEKPKVQPKQVEPAKAQSTAQPSIKMQAFPPPVAVQDDLADDIKALDPEVAVGPVDNLKGTVNAVNGDTPGDTHGKGDGPGTAETNTPFDAVEVMPQPVGGDAAWAKFLQKNLRYPAVARENDKSGRVYLSFIVERDGRLSDITVIRKAGFGFDEEALRVLKLAPAWKPGIQNGASVRVRYTVPINFQMSTE